MSSNLWLVACVVMVPGILWASWIDHKERRVPNWLNGAIALAGFVAQAYFAGGHGLLHGFVGMWVGFACLILPWMMHGMGAGDVKLMMAIGVWLGPWWTFVSFCVGVVIGGIIAAIMIVSSGRLAHACVNLSAIMGKISHKETIFSEYASAKSFGSTSQLLPYGVPLTIGTLIIFFGPWGLGQLMM